MRTIALALVAGLFFASGSAFAQVVVYPTPVTSYYAPSASLATPVTS
jgi:hypothetical protein